MSKKNGETQQPEQQVIQILVEFNTTTGEISVNGPLDNRVLCYGILELAREAVHNRYQQQRKEQQGKIIVPDVGIPPLRG